MMGWLGPGIFGKREKPQDEIRKYVDREIGKLRDEIRREIRYPNGYVRIRRVPTEAQRESPFTYMYAWPYEIETYHPRKGIEVPVKGGLDAKQARRIAMALIEGTDAKLLDGTRGEEET